MSNQIISLFMLRFTLFSLICLLSLLPVRSQTDCPNPYDGNGDGAVTGIDLLGLLLVFGDFDLDLACEGLCIGGEAGLPRLVREHAHVYI